MSGGRKTSSKGKRRNGPRFVVRRSSIHGKGVFARQLIKKGETVIRYRGVLVSEAEADRTYPDDDAKPAHTFLFLLSSGMVIDGNHAGNSGRWINHSCDPNCETEEDEDGRVFITALRNIRAGEELTYDYNLVLDEPLTGALRERYRCLCGTDECRGTQFGRRRYRPKRTRIAA